MVQDTEYLGFHHIHLSSPDPDGTLAWYQNIFGGESDQLKGRLNGLRYGTTWLLVSQLREGTLAATQSRAIDHLGWSFPDVEASSRGLGVVDVGALESPIVPWLPARSAPAGRGRT